MKLDKRAAGLIAGIVVCALVWIAPLDGLAPISATVSDRASRTNLNSPLRTALSSRLMGSLPVRRPPRRRIASRPGPAAFSASGPPGRWWKGVKVDPAFAPYLLMTQIYYPEIG